VSSNLLVLRLRLAARRMYAHEESSRIRDWGEAIWEQRDPARATRIETRANTRRTPAWERACAVKLKPRVPTAEHAQSTCAMTCASGVQRPARAGCAACGCARSDHVTASYTNHHFRFILPHFTHYGGVACAGEWRCRCALARGGTVSPDATDPHETRHTAHTGHSSHHPPGTTVPRRPVSGDTSPRVP
jgi:hypothetical protein